MSRLVTWKKAVLLLGMGTAAVVFPMPFPGTCSPFLSNGDVIGFYQTTGGLAIDAAFDPARGIYGAGSDWNVIVLEPTVDVIQTVWDHWVWSEFPKDPVPNFD